MSGLLDVFRRTVNIWRTTKIATRTSVKAICGETCLYEEEMAKRSRIYRWKEVLMASTIIIAIYKRSNNFWNVGGSGATIWGIGYEGKTVTKFITERLNSGKSISKRLTNELTQIAGETLQFLYLLEKLVQLICLVVLVMLRHFTCLYDLLKWL